MFVCCVPRNRAEFLRVLSLEQSLFGGFTVPADVARQFFRLRPEIYQAVVASGNTLAAYTSIYPLQPRWAGALIAGDISEPDLKPGMLLTPQASLEDATLYVGSVVVSDRYDPVTKSTLIASLIAWRARQLAVASLKRFSLIMTPVTKHGERLVRHGGAKLLTEGSRRKDGRAIYGREITHGFHSRVMGTVERLLNGSIVEMKYNFPSAGRRQDAAADVDDKATISLPAL